MNSSSIWSSPGDERHYPNGVFSRTRPWDFGENSQLTLFIFGTIGNLLSIVVARSKRMRNTNASLFVTSIAVADILVLFFKFAANMIKLYKIPIFNFCILIHNILPQTAMFASIWLIIITTLERTIAVLFPFNVAIVFSQRRCKVIIVCMVLFFLILSSTLSPCLEYYLEKPYYCQIRGSLNGTCYHYYSYIYPWIKSSLGSWIPSLLTFCLNIIIIKTLYTASKNRKSIANVTDETTNNRKFHQLNNAQIERLVTSFERNKNLDYSKSSEDTSYQVTTKLTREKFTLNGNHIAQSSDHHDEHHHHHHHHHHKERQITIMLITISISFLILSFPYSAFDLLRKLNVQWKFLKNRELLRIVMLLMDLNHATNFLVYCLSGQKFRKELKSIFLNLFSKKKTFKYTAKNNTRSNVH